jgi:hypothetical protein
MKSINKGLAIGASLVAGSVMALSASSAQAAILLSNGSLNVSGPTTFTFTGSNGLFQSDLGLYVGNTLVGSLLLTEAAPGFTQIPGDFPGDCAICSSTVNLSAGVDYTLGLISSVNGISQGTVFSNTNAISTGPNSAAFEDNGGSVDFNDFRFNVTTASVPEPTALGGLGLVAGALVFSRRRKSNKTV